MAISDPTVDVRPRWPDGLPDPLRVHVSYYPPADEFLVYFAERPVPSYSDALNGPGYDDVAVMVGMHPDESSTGEVVGIQVIPLLLGAVRDRPEWATLAWAVMADDLGRETLREELPKFFAEVEEAFVRYWRPAPPIEEQLARLPRAEAGNG
jgi:hypothetical protein